MSKMFIALMLLCTLFGATVSLTDEERKLASETDQKAYQIKRQIEDGEPGTPPGEEVPETAEPEIIGETGPETAPPDETKPSITVTEYNANKANDWLFTLTVNDPPEDQATIRFQEGTEPQVGIGGSTTSFEFKEAKSEEGKLNIPVSVKDRAETKQITFTVSLGGESTPITVNVEAAESESAFKVLENPITATEETKWTFILRIEASEQLTYKFKEGDKQVNPEEETDSLKFGDLTHKNEGGKDQVEVEVTVTDVSKDSVDFDVSAGDTTVTVTVIVEPPAKPMLLNNKFTAGKTNNYTFTLEIRAKVAPDVVFKDGDQEVKPGEKTDHFTIGTMTNDEDYIYKIEVTVSKDIDESLKLIVKLDGEENEITVDPEDDSSALISASVTMTSLLVPLLLMIIL